MDQSESAPWIETNIFNDPTRSERIEQLVQALAIAQSKIKSPERNRIVKVVPKSGGQGYEFRYATLDHIIEVIREPLTSNGLWFTQILKLDQEGSSYILDTRLLHGSGQWIACQTPLLFEGGGNQQFGSALTFMRRYSLTTLLGIAAEEDDDANAADGNTINQSQDRKPIAPKPDVMKADPISTGFNTDMPFALAVPRKQDETGEDDWVAFGKNLIGVIKESKTSGNAELWWIANSPSLDQMERKAPKTYANLNTAMIKTLNDLKQTESKNAGTI